MSFNSAGGNTDFADFGSHPSDCYQDPSPAGCPDGVSVMISVYVRETGANKFIVGTDTPLNIRGFEIFLDDNELRCSFYTSNQRYDTVPGIVISVNSMLSANQSINIDEVMAAFSRGKYMERKATVYLRNVGIETNRIRGRGNKWVDSVLPRTLSVRSDFFPF